VCAAEYRLDVVAASVGPVVRQSILESYDGNKCYLLSTQILAKVTLSRLFFFNFFLFYAIYYLKHSNQPASVNVSLLKSQLRFQKKNASLMFMTAACILLIY